MRISTRTQRAGVLAALAPLAALSMVSNPAAYAADPRVEGAMVVAPTGAFSALESDAAEDTRHACLASIPQNASDGQRLLAEQRWARAERARKAIRVAPTF